MMEFILGFLSGIFVHRLYVFVLLKYTPQIDWYAERPKLYFWRFWK